MNVTKLQNAFMRRIKGVNKTLVTKFNFNRLPCVLSYNINDDYSTSRTNAVQDFMFGNQQSMLLNNVVVEQYGARVHNKFSFVSHPRIISHGILHNGVHKYIGYQIHHVNQNYTSVRHFSSVHTVAETKAFSGIFRTLSESMPVKIAQDSLLWVHDYTGLPWWSVIVFTTIMMRAMVTVPLSLYQQCIFAKLENLKHEMDEIVKELKKETNYGMHKYNWSKEYAGRLYNHSMKKQWNKLIVRDNCHPLKASILILVQVPLWISLSISIRNLCYMLPKQDASAYATYQEFATDGFLWVTNLTVADPIVLPIAMGLFNLAIIEVSRMNRVRELKKLEKYLSYFLRIVTIGMIPVAMHVPSCVSLYWATSSAFGLLQNLVLLSPKLRRFAKVPVTDSESPHPYSLLRERMIARYSFKRKAVVSPKA